MFPSLSLRGSRSLSSTIRSLQEPRLPLSRVLYSYRSFLSSSYNCDRVLQPTRSSLKAHKAQKTSEPSGVGKDPKVEYREARENLTGALFAEKNPLKALDIARSYSMKRYSALGEAKIEDTTFALYRLVMEYHAQRKEYSRVPMPIESMKRIGLPVTIDTYTGFMTFLGKSGHPGAVQALFKQLRKDGLQPNTLVYNILIDTYVHQGDAKNAMKYFEEMPKNGASPDTVTYNLILKLLSKAKDLDTSIAEGVFEEMKTKGLPLNQATIVTLLKIFCESQSEQSLLEAIKVAHDHQISLNLKCYSSIIRFYALQRNLKQAFDWFEDLKAKGLTPDAFVYSQLLEGCVRVESFDRALDIYKTMEANGVKPDAKSLSSLFFLLIKQRKPEEALRLYDENSKLKHDSRSYHTLITGLVGYPQYHPRCHSIFKDMVYHGVKPNDKVLSALLRVCFEEGSTSKAEAYFENAKKYMALKVEHFNGLMAILEKENSHQKVVELYEELTATDNKPNVISHRLVLRALVNLDRLDEAVPHGLVLKRKGKLESWDLVTEAFAKAGRNEELKVLLSADNTSSKTEPDLESNTVEDSSVFDSNDQK